MESWNTRDEPKAAPQEKACDQTPPLSSAGSPAGAAPATNSAPTSSSLVDGMPEIPPDFIPTINYDGSGVVRRSDYNKLRAHAEALQAKLDRAQAAVRNADLLLTWLHQKTHPSETEGMHSFRKKHAQAIKESEK